MGPIGTKLVIAGAATSALTGGASQVALYAAEHPSSDQPDANIGLGIALLAGSALSIGAGVPAAIGAQFLNGPARLLGTGAALAGLALGGHVAYTGYRNATEGS